MLLSLNSSLVAASSKYFCNNYSATSHFLHPKNYSFQVFINKPFSSSSTTTSFSRSSSSTLDARDFSVPNPGKRANYSGVTLNDTVEISSSKKLRLDAWISSRIDGISRARVQSSIKSGLVSVNGRKIDKASYMVKGGDRVHCAIADLQPLRAEPEDIPLDIVYEDEHVIVVNKPAQMVVHPAPGNPSGTLVNGILHHCSLPTGSFSTQELLSEDDDPFDEEVSLFPSDQTSGADISSGVSDASVRPGIVHRLDKGTSGLLVVAKNEHSHAHLAEQFKKHTIKRVYISLTCGVPSPISGRVDVPIGRDSNNRVRMIAVSGSNKSGKTRHAASRYRVIEILAGGGCALVEWRLETGRTHQIRAHAKYLGVPLLGDEVYGGTKSMALSLLQPKTIPAFHGMLLQLLSRLERPCLHALTLGFRHPHTDDNMNFSQLPPEDFAEVLSHLREISTEKEKVPTAASSKNLGELGSTFYDRSATSGSHGGRPPFNTHFPPLFNTHFPPPFNTDTFYGYLPRHGKR